VLTERLRDNGHIVAAELPAARISDGRTDL
jgi:hypothetical protein